MRVHGETPWDQYQALRFRDDPVPDEPAVSLDAFLDQSNAAFQCECRGDRNRHGQHIVDHQGTTRQGADPTAEHFAGHQVPAAAAWEGLDDVRVALRNDEDGKHRRQGETDR